MQKKLKLAHEDMAILAAIADQELSSTEVSEEIPLPLRWDEPVYIRLNELARQGLLIKIWRPFRYYYAIAPEILALNNPPYSYESWRALSE